MYVLHVYSLLGFQKYVKQNFNVLLICLLNISTYLLYNLFSQAALSE